MKVTYCGCKSIMKAERTTFPRGKTTEVTDEIGNKLLKITGFFLTMNSDAKKELKFNEEREKREIEKLESGVTTIVKPEPDSEVETLTESVSELTEQLSVSMGEVETLTELLSDSESQVEELKKELLVEQAKSVTSKDK